tara:strand:+ start:177 stop:440 length:264 start_codon:yes stop_codon:yes gene_type:complete
MTHLDAAKAAARLYISSTHRRRSPASFEPEPERVALIAALQLPELANVHPHYPFPVYILPSGSVVACRATAVRRWVEWGSRTHAEGA